jgi:hypothetical protein
MKKTCANCNKEFEAKRLTKLFCSNKCKIAYARRADKDKHQGSDVAPEPLVSDLTEVDQLFDESKPGYYNFGPMVREAECLVCEQKFQTRLGLLRVCSPEHYDELTGRLSTMPKK